MQYTWIEKQNFKIYDYEKSENNFGGVQKCNANYLMDMILKSTVSQKFTLDETSEYDFKGPQNCSKGYPKKI